MKIDKSPFTKGGCVTTLAAVMVGAVLAAILTAIVLGHALKIQSMDLGADKSTVTQTVLPRPTDAVVRIYSTMHGKGGLIAITSCLSAYYRPSIGSYVFRGCSRMVVSNK